MATWLDAGPTRCIVTVSDAEGYSQLPDDQQRDLQNRMAEIERQAAQNANLNRRKAFVQGTGDGNLVAWPPDTNELRLIADYLRELQCELERVNRTLSKQNRIRLRVAVSTGLVEKAAQGITGQAAIIASLLVDSDASREALRKNPTCSLAVILDTKVYEDVVKTRRRGLQPDEYRCVTIQDKHGSQHMAWLSVCGSGRYGFTAPSGGLLGRDADSAPSEGQKTAGPAGAVRINVPVKPAVIGAVAVIAAAGITATATLISHAGGSSAHSVTGSTASTSTPATGRTAGRLYTEMTDNHLGTKVFSNSEGGAVSRGPISIPFGQHVKVKCWASNQSTMSSVNDFYLIETPPWASEFAPANTFLNSDTTGALDPKVPECPHGSLPQRSSF